MKNIRFFTGVLVGCLIFIGIPVLIGVLIATIAGLTSIYWWVVVSIIALLATIFWLR